MFPPTAFSFGIEIFSDAEVQNDGLAFDRAALDGDGEELSMSFVLEVLLADCILYGILASVVCTLPINPYLFVRFYTPSLIDSTRSLTVCVSVQKF